MLFSGIERYKAMCFEIVLAPSTDLLPAFVPDESDS